MSFKFLDLPRRRQRREQDIYRTPTKLDETGNLLGSSSQIGVSSVFLRSSDFEVYF